MTHTDVVLKVSGLTGGYGKGSHILEDINLSVARGEIVGLIGLNGAGKSTTLKMLLGLLQPEHGEIRIGGYDIYDEPVRAKGKLGYIPEIPMLYDELTLDDHLRFTAMAYGMSETEMHERMSPLVSAFRMDEHLHEFPSTFSKGMRQKVMVLCAFLHQADLFLVDEPFIGLDPKAFRELTNLFIESKEHGAGVLITTHVLDSAERLCDRVLILHKGRLVASGTLDQLRQQVVDRSSSIDSLKYEQRKDVIKWSLLQVFEALIEAGDLQ